MLLVPKTLQRKTLRYYAVDYGWRWNQKVQVFLAPHDFSCVPWDLVAQDHRQHYAGQPEHTTHGLGLRYLPGHGRAGLGGQGP